MKSKCVSLNSGKYATILSGALILFGLYLTGLYSYPLLHSLTELFGAIVPFAVFILAWNSRGLLDNHYLLFLGIASLFVGGLNTIHALAYSDMGIFPAHDANQPTQLYVATQYVWSLSVLIAPVFLDRRVKASSLVFGYTGFVLLVLGAIFSWDVFPDAYIEGVGLTPFKKISEYVISGIFLTSLAMLLRHRRQFDRDVLRYLVSCLGLTIVAELAFTLYTGVYGLPNLAGHLARILSFYFLYKAIVETGLVRPYDLLFRNLKQSEEALRTANSELEQANRQLAEASRHKSEFLANMSHELRTPLNSILGFSHLLLEQTTGVLPAKQTRYLAHIHTSGKHLLQLISDILDLSKVEAGKFVLQPEPLPVVATLEDILVIARGLANRKGQVVQTQIEADLPPLHADPVRFKQILFNLLSNAVKFTPAGGQITLTARRIADCRLHPPAATHAAQAGIADLNHRAAALQSEISTLESEIEISRLELSVTDTGAGIRPGDLPKLFGEFVQLETTQAQRHEGSGLGLALTKRLVELHGGRIWAASEGEGRGSTFTVVLPFAGPRDL